MATSSVPRILVVGARSGSGKSLLVTGVLMALRRKRVSVACCVAGRSMQQATLLQRLSNRYVPSLDRLLLSDSQVLDTVGRAGAGADIVLIDGRAGVFDGDSLLNSSNSDAHFAELLSCPCVLVVDTHEVTPSLCALVSGFIHHEHAPYVAGVVINGLEQRELGKALDSTTEREMCNELFSKFDLPPCLGCIPARGLQAVLPAASMVQEENGIALPLQFLSDIEQMVSSSVDIDAILSLAAAAPSIEYDELREVVGKHQCRIAVASDNCFHPCYQDNIALLQTYGADIIRFSPLADTTLPNNIGGLYLPGACLSDYAEEIESNMSLLSAIADFIRQGGAVFSEGGGSALLCRSFQPAGCERAYQGVGSIPLEVYQRRCSASPARGVLLDGCLFGEFGESIGALYAGDWKIRGQGAYPETSSDMLSTLRIEVSPGSSFLEGYSVSAETFSTFQFLHFGSNPHFARAFVEVASIHQRTAKGKVC
jgi:cobyrinic acid a,c-diamide synthase